MKTTLRFAVGFATALGMAASQAALVRGSVTSSNPGNDYYPAACICDNTPTTEWVTKNGYGNDYFAGGGPVPVLTVDLGGVYALSGLAYWGYGNSGNNAKTITVAFSTDGTTYGSAVVYTPNAPVEPGSEERKNVYEQDWSFSTVAARYVRLTVTDNWYGGTCTNGDACTGGDRVGFSEVAFVVPEPASLGLLVIGGLLVMPRRQSRS